MKSIRKRLSRDSKKILIIASKEESEYIVKKLLLDKHNYDSIKCFSHNVNDEMYVLINNVDKIYIGNNINENDKSKIIKYCLEREKTVYLVPGLYEIALVNSQISQINDMLVFKVDSMGLTFGQAVIKRVLDLAISFVGLFILLPFLFIISIMIKVYDGGPVFYKQKRVTKDNKIFDLYKFRTMVVDAEKNVGPVLAIEKDARITPIGRFLRTFRIDEIPQLFNVLKGDMSIVGPRPERPFFVQKYNQEVEDFKYRVFVKAGITGLAQVLGKYSTDPENKVKYDLLYIRNYSLLLDLKIIFNTVKTIFNKDSAKGVSQNKELDEISWY
ncbi:MAG: sugar transferase [Clostridia bacterium]|jgi:exopolysaccharide biosynthesis polyprenyl glycosylphosphotransferase|nr:sugar transferase [Clostridia bacterium]